MSEATARGPAMPGRSVRARSMSDRAARRLALGGWLLTVGATVAAVVIRALADVPVLPNRFGLGDAGLVAFAVLAIVSATMGAVVLVRLPRQWVGWNLLVGGALYSVALFGSVAASVAAGDGRLGIGLAQWAGWIAWIASSGAGTALFALLLFFPNGPPSGWLSRSSFRVVLGLSIVMWLLLWLQPGPMLLLSTLDNPAGIGPDLFGAFESGRIVVMGALLVVFGVPAIALVLFGRFRRSRGVERQQFKWFAAGGVLAFVALVVMLWFGASPSSRGANEWPIVAFALASTAIPLAIGMAILRYHLYEIDRIISRTISYGVVTAVLVAVFASVVVGLQTVLAPFTRGDTLAVAASTLVVAALFQPVRRRVQRGVDRRFNRATYDAQRTTDAFGRQLRNEVDLARLRVALVDVVDEAVNPVSASVWLRRSSR
jgi:hypothetical protein